MDPATPAPGETPAPQPPKNEATPPVTPPVVEKTTDDSEVEAARKRAEQAEMRANQLANQLKAKEDAEAANKAKELEEQNKFKELYEQEKAKREAIENEAKDAEAKQALAETNQSILADYSDEVKAAAKDLDLALPDVTEEAVADFKAKLDKLQARVGQQKVTPNNPSVINAPGELTGEELRQTLADPAKRDAYFRAKNGATAMMMAPPKG